MKIALLGAGLVGAPMARDLAKDFDVTVCDVNEPALARLAGVPRISTRKVDLLRREAVMEVAAASDLVLSAVPGFMGYRTLEAILESGTNVVDIAFFAEDPFALAPLAEKKGVTAFVDMGVYPGMGSVLAGRAHAQLDTTHSILTYVGGLPRVRTWPYEYKAVFSPIDVIEEYVRPARYVEGGVMVTRPALSDPELVEFPAVGTLEAFNTDGLRTMATTLRDVPNMKEKTLRYPGHIEKMRMLRESGFFGTEPVDVEGAAVRPIDLTAKLLASMWKLAPGEVDVTVLRIEIDGTKDGAPTRVVYELDDEYDPHTGVHSMARTTGYTATSAVRMLARGIFTKKGLFAPEQLGPHAACVDFLLAELRARGVHYQERVEHPTC